MKNQYRDLGLYSDLADAAGQRLYPLVKAGPRTRKQIRDFLAFNPPIKKARSVKISERWTRDGVDGQLVSWSLGYGPRTEAYLLRPAGVKGRLPGVVALHDHGGFKFLGKEKIATGPLPQTPVQLESVNACYGGRAWADELARRGFAVLVPDCFLWGSRKFPIDAMTSFDRDAGQAFIDLLAKRGPDTSARSPQMQLHTFAAIFHENLVQKYCHALGTTLSGIIAHEDRVAAAWLANRKDVVPGGVACAGLSGGGLRSTLLRATSPDIRAAVVVGLMSTYEGMLDHNIISHTWMLFPHPGLAHAMDWPDVASCSAPSPLLVQYDNEDPLFTLEGMKAAHRRIARVYKNAGAPENYRGTFYPGPHKFDLPMQEEAFAWIGKQF